MVTFSWLRRLTSQRLPASGKRRRARQSARLQVEQLESRLAPANLVQNPGFETGSFAPWATSGSGGNLWSVSTTNPHSGTYAAQFTKNGLAQTASLSQTLTGLTAGQGYTLSFWFLNGNSNDPTEILKTSVTNTSTKSTDLNQQFRATSASYVQFTFTFLATGSSESLSFNIVSPNTNIWLDDVSVTSGLSMPTDNGATAVSQVVYTGGGSFAGKMLGTVPAKYVTIQNDSNQMIYPYFRDQNSGTDPRGTAPGGTTFYDPMDPQTNTNITPNTFQEYRAYVGYQDGSGNKYLGLPPGASITVTVPLVFWDGANLYLATDGQNLLNTGNPNVYGYTGNQGTSTTASVYSVRFSANSTTPGAPGGKGWVSFTPGVNNSVGAVDGVVTFYHVNGQSLTATPDAAAQLTEFTIRDPFLADFKVSSAQSILLINYDVSYVDSAAIPIGMEATSVPIPIAVNPPSPLPTAPFGWAGSTMDLSIMQSTLQSFTSSNNKLLGSYFSPLGSSTPGPGWPAYTTPANLNTLKIPSGYNIFLNSPLNDQRSKYDPTNLTFSLDSSGPGPVQAFATVQMGSGTQLTATFSTVSNRDAFVAAVKSWEANGQTPISVFNNSTSTQLTPNLTDAQAASGTTATLFFNGTVTVSAAANSFTFTQHVTDYAASRIRDIWYAWLNYYVNLPANQAFKDGTSYGGTIGPNPNEITLDSTPAYLNLGMSVTSTIAGVPANTTILYIDPKNPRHIFLSQNITLTGHQTFLFSKPGKPAYMFFNDPTITPISLSFKSNDPKSFNAQFAAAVYEAMAAEGAITNLPFKTNLPPSMNLVALTIGGDIKDLPNSDDHLGGQVRDVIKSILRGVPDFTNPIYADESTWYPNPAVPDKSQTNQTFNVYNLDPYVWFIHEELGMSAYGFSLDDDAGNIGANGTNNLTMTVSGISGLPNKNEWAPSLNFGLQIPYATIMTSSLMQLQNPQMQPNYWQIKPDDPKNSIIGAYLTGPGIPQGTNLKSQGQAANLQFNLSTSSAKPDGQARYIFTAKPKVASNVFNDSFHRPDSPTLGVNWTTLLGTMSIKNNQAFGQDSGVGVDQAQYNGGANLTNVIVSATVTLNGSGYGGVFARRDSQGDMYVALLVYDPKQPNGNPVNYLALYRFSPSDKTSDNGWTLLTQLPLTNTKSGDLQLEVVGSGTHTSLQLFFNSAFALSWTEGDRIATTGKGLLSNPINGPGGVGLINITNAGSTFTNFSVFTVPQPFQGQAGLQASTSPTLAGVTDPNAIYVDSLYQTLLGRSADPGAYAWTGLLDAGGLPSAVVQGIENSTEYLNNLVNNLYQQYLGRTADPAGLSGWTTLLQNGGTIEQVIIDLVGSPEYFNIYGSNSAFVASLYQNILGRTGSGAEIQGWVNAMANGATASQVAGSFLSSQEYLTDVVQSYYQTYLGRAADQAGLTAWVSQLQQGVHDQTVLADLLGSTEGFADYSQPVTPQSTVDPNTNYVEFVYQSLLGRDADAGADGWINYLDAGGSPVAVVQAIENSSEYLDDLVNNLYEQYLGRAADPGGLGAYVAFLQGGGTIEQVIDGIVASPEYFNIYGNDNAFVASLYQNILNRAGSSAEIQGWVTAMGNGMTAAQVASAILSSQEYRSNLIEDYYQAFLNRPADSAGLTAWLNALNQGVADQVVLASILGSPEAVALHSA